MGDTGGRAGDSRGGECSRCVSGETTPSALARGGIWGVRGCSWLSVCAPGPGIGVSWSGAGDTVTSVAAKLKALRRSRLEPVVVQWVTGDPQDVMSNSFGNIRPQYCLSGVLGARASGGSVVVPWGAGWSAEAALALVVLCIARCMCLRAAVSCAPPPEMHSKQESHSVRRMQGPWACKTSYCATTGNRPRQQCPALPLPAWWLGHIRPQLLLSAT